MFLSLYSLYIKIGVYKLTDHCKFIYFESDLYIPVPVPVVVLKTYRYPYATMSAFDKFIT
jgi:hypothetical protein